MSHLVNIYGVVKAFTLRRRTLVNCTYTVCDLEKALFLSLNGGA